MLNLDITDWISIASIGASLVTWICTALFFYKRQSIINKFNQDLETHKAQLSKDIARSTTTLEERISVMKEVLRRIAAINQQVNQLRSYNSYECKNNVDFSDKDICNHECDKKCIVHVWEHICKLYNDIHLFEEYLISIIPLLSETAELIINSYIMLIMSVSKKAIEKGTDYKKNEKEKMLSAISVFSEVSTDTLTETYDKIVFMYRIMLNVPIEEYPIKKLSKIIHKNNNIVEQILKL